MKFKPLQKFCRPLLWFTILILVLFMPVTFIEASVINEVPACLTGSWQTEAYVQSGPAQGNTYRGWNALLQEGEQLTGIFFSYPYSGTCSGTYHDGLVNLDGSTEEGYHSHVTATVSGDGTRIQGTWFDNYGNSGTYKAGRLTALSYTGLDAVLNIAKLDPGRRSIRSFIADPVDTASGAHCIEHTLLSINTPSPFSSGSLTIPFCSKKVL